jgi:hypothetical protein
MWHVCSDGKAEHTVDYTSDSKRLQYFYFNKEYTNKIK